MDSRHSNIKKTAFMLELLGFVRRVSALGDASLKTGWNASPVECSFTARKLECEPSPFLTCFCGAAIGIA
ncbi:hypothetical protein PSEUDO8Z_70022 [Pseudomonas sp. 8Z]|nr:hypothetical protein PSEUDO8Z_70022 [Pseudomonas sp. 8Z]